MKLIPDIEKKSLKEIEAFQLQKLVEVIGYVSRHSQFYKKHFETNGIDPESIQTLQDLQRIPVTTKEDLQKFNWDFACVPKEKLVEFTSTSGTLGKPVTIGLTEGDVKRLAYNEYLSFVCADGTEKDRYQLMLTLDRQFMAGIAYYEGIRKLGAGIIRIGPGSPAMQLESILRLEPTALVAVPSFLVKLVEYGKQQGVDLNTTSIKKALCIGESLRTEDLSLNVLAEKIKADWDLKLYGTYASTEMQTAFTECNCGRGGHHHPELIIVEVLDDQGNQVLPGEPGEITITTLGVEGMPLLRYQTGDIATFYDKPCPCGRNTIRLGPVLGRKQQMIKLKGTSVYPSGIFEIINQIDGVQDYVVEALTGPLGTDELHLHLLVSDPEVIQNVKDRFHSGLRVVPQIKEVDRKTLDAFQFSGEGRKVKRFLDHR